MRSKGALLQSDKAGVAGALLVTLVHRCKAKLLLRAAHERAAISLCMSMPA